MARRPSPSPDISCPSAVRRAGTTPKNLGGWVVVEEEGGGGKREEEEEEEVRR